jgi:hypothetical protein
VELETFRTLRKNRREKVDSRSLERGVRQLLADKISGNLVGLRLLAPEHLRLGTGDLLTRGAGPSPSDLSPCLALPLIHEAALGVVHLRTSRTLSPKGFELLNGRPFVVADSSLHDLLGTHTVQQGEELPLAWVACVVLAATCRVACSPSIPTACPVRANDKYLVTATTPPSAPPKSSPLSSASTPKPINPSAFYSPPLP